MLRRLWLARGDELRRGRAIDLPSIFIPEMVGMGPLYQLWDWWPECDGGGDDNGPDKNEIGHWRVLHAAAVNAQVRLFGRPDARNIYPAAVQMAATLLPAPFLSPAERCRRRIRCLLRACLRASPFGLQWSAMARRSRSHRSGGWSSGRPGAATPTGRGFPRRRRRVARGLGLKARRQNDIVAAAGIVLGFPPP